MYWLAQGTIQRGWALAERGPSRRGHSRDAPRYLARAAYFGIVLAYHYLALLAEAHGKAGQTEEALRLINEALAAVPASGRFWEAEIHRLKGEIVLRSNRPDAPRAAEACFQQALAIARLQSAKSLELRTSMSLGRLWQRQGKSADARRQLAEIYGWFREGFATADLQEAKMLLNSLA
ncbi:MAG: hypothetical protein U1F68_00220 [Gammaproteobacteria bacterium]